MQSSLRQAVLILATGSFLVMTSGLALSVHLHFSDHHDHQCDHDRPQHDSEHCSFCQRLLTSMKGFAPSTESPQVGIVDSGQTVEVSLGAPRPRTGVRGLQARAPPA